MSAPALAPPPSVAGMVEAQCTGCEVWFEPHEIGRVWPGGPLLCWLDGGDLEDWQLLADPPPDPEFDAMYEQYAGFRERKQNGTGEFASCGCATGGTCSAAHQATRAGYAERIAQEKARLHDLGVVQGEQLERIKEQLRTMFGQSFGADVRFPGARGV